MEPGIRNRHEQHCPVCEQPLNDDQRTMEAQEVLFMGAAAYAWCPLCSRQVPGPWDAAYKVRWADAFVRACARLKGQAKNRRSLWRLREDTGVVVELVLADDDSGYVLHYIQNGQEQTTERFRSRESASLRADELRHRLENQGFHPSGREHQPGANAGTRQTDLWTVTTRDGHQARATLISQARLLVLAWFVDDKPEGVEEFSDWDAAMRRAGELRMVFLNRGES